MNATLLLGMALSVGAPGLKDPPKKANDISGEWVLESTAASGKSRTTTGSELVYTFTPDGNWLIHRDGKELVAPDRGYVVDPKPNPPTIDLVSNQTNADNTRRSGIYKLEGDTLTISVAMPRAGRANDFESTSDNRHTVFIMKRKK